MRGEADTHAPDVRVVVLFRPVCGGGIGLDACQRTPCVLAILQCHGDGERVEEFWEAVGLWGVREVGVPIILERFTERKEVDVAELEAIARSGEERYRLAISHDGFPTPRARCSRSVLDRDRGVPEASRAV